MASWAITKIVLGLILIAFAIHPNAVVIRLILIGCFLIGTGLDDLYWRSKCLRNPEKPQTRRRGPRLAMDFAILAILAWFTIAHSATQARQQKAATEIISFRAAMDAFAMDNFHYPTAQEGLKALTVNVSNLPTWRGPYLPPAGSLIDPWHQPYHYRIPGTHGDYDIYSYGADNKEGGEGEDADLFNR